MKRSCVFVRSCVLASLSIDLLVFYDWTGSVKYSVIYWFYLCVVWMSNWALFIYVPTTFTDSHTLLIAKLFLYIPSLRIVLFTTLLYACINFYASLCKVVQYTLHIFIEWNFYEFYRNNIFLSLYIDIELLNASSPFVWQIKFVSFFFHCVWIRVLNTESG